MFIPLMITTDYSLLESMITIPKLLLFLLKYHIPVCGICDKNLFGVMEFYNTMKENNIKPLIGLHVTCDETPLYLYAKNYEGYQSLLKINTKIKENISLDYLQTFAHTIQVIIPYIHLKKYQELSNIFPDIYIGYSSSYEKNTALVETSHIVFCPEIKAFTKKDSEYLRVLKAIDYGESLKLIHEKNLEKFSLEYYFKEEIKEDETQKFIHTIQIEIPKTKRYIPKFCEEKDSFLYLEALSIKGLKKRLKNNVIKKYEERLKTELEVIKEMGFADYFLIVYDYVRYAKMNKILVGVGRGSAVGSLVSYCLGITDVDPLAYNLLFERFLNKDRITMPDIDIDFEETRRNEVKEYVKQKYGSNCVANILAFGTLKSKLALRSVGKALEINQTVIDSFLNKMDSKISLEENLKKQEVSYYVTSNKEIQKMYEIAMKIEGLKKNISTHAAGVVISSTPLEEIIPVFYSGSELLTGLTMNYLEELGLLKMDFLSISNLTTMAGILDLIEEKTSKKLNLNQIDLNDPKVLNLFHTANTLGIFQFESEGMKHFLKKLKPTSFLDLVSAIALYRPGPMENIDTFIRRKERQEPIEYLHEDLKDILEETYGIIVYQEQIMQILVKIGGFSFSEADIIRRAMSKKKKDLITSFYEKFLEGATSLGYKKDLAKQIYEMILKFANYGFNKSHSVSYALFGYQMAYLKVYYPIYFIANILNRNISSIPKTKEYLAYAKKKGITILPPSINKSEEYYKIVGNSLIIPFELIKGLGSEAAKTIIENRGSKPYTDFFDFVKRTYGKSITKKTIALLIQASCFDEFCKNHEVLEKSMDKALNYAILSLDLEEDYVMKPTLDLGKIEEDIDYRKEEYEIFGFYLSNHPASRYIEPQIMKLEHIKENYNKHIKCVVLVEKIKELTTKNNEKMAFLTASDETDIGNFVVFASVMKDLKNVKIGDLIVIEGRIARRFLEYQINVNKIEKISGG